MNTTIQAEDALVALLDESRTSLMRAFYISLFISLVTIYMVYETEILPTLPLANVEESIRPSLESLDQVLQLNDDLNSDREVMRGYQSFLAPFVAIDSAAEQAISGVDGSDPRWLTLNPRDRDLARRTSDNIQWLEHQATWFLDDDLRDLPVFNLKHFATYLIYPETEFDSIRITEGLQASARVAEALGQDITLPEQWPISYFLTDFARDNGFSSVSERIGDIREEYGLAEISAAVDQIERFCLDNDIAMPECSSLGIKRVFARGELKIMSIDDDKLPITFFPTGVHRTLVFKLSPLISLVAFYMFLGQMSRWKTLVAAVRERYSPRDPVVRSARWSMTDAVAPNSGDGWSVVHQITAGFVMLALAAPFIAQAAVAYYGFQHARAAEWSAIWPSLASACALMSAIGLAEILTELHKPEADPGDA